MPKSATPIFLSDDDKSYLKSVLQKGTIEARVHRRAKILLLKSDGMADEAIADKLDISRPTVKLCLKKYRESGVKTALEDSKGRGRRIEITDDAKAWVINIACQKPCIRPSGRIMVSFKPYPVHQFCRWAGRIFPHGDGI